MINHEEYVNKVKERNPNIEILSIYKGARSRIDCRCKIHNTTNNVYAYSILQGKGCKQCGLDKLANEFRKTREKFIEELNRVNKDIEVLGDYINNKTKIDVKCKIHNYTWSAKPSHLLEGSGCIYCAKQRASDILKLNLDDFINRVNSDVEVLSEYKNMKSQISCKCKICGYEWNTIAESIMNGSSCPVCKNTIRQSTETIIDRLKLSNPNIELIGERKGYDEKTKFRCKLCENIFYTSLNNALSGHGCSCNKISVGETKIIGILNKYKIDFIREYRFNDCKNIFTLPFDFYIPKSNTVIEYDGIQHFTPIEFFGGQEAFDNTIRRDCIKDNYCKENNIKIIRVKYTENDIEKYLIDNLKIV